MFKVVVNIIMAVLVSASSAGFVLGKHYCMGELKSTAVFAHAKQCHQEEQSACPYHSRNLQIEKENCCQDEISIVEGIDLTTSGAYKVPFIPDLGITMPAYTYIIAPVNFFEKGQWQYCDLPPPVIRDIPVLVQSFLL